ncbi:MAG: O-antigen ligase family protein [Alphaproteobacteria bacterium]
MNLSLIKNQFGLFFACFALCLIVPYASNATVIALAVAAIGKHKIAPLFFNIKQQINQSCFLSVLAIIAIGFLSSLWSIMPSVSLSLASRILILFLVLNLNLSIIKNLDARTSSALQKTLITAFVLLLVFYGFDLATGATLASLIKGEEQLNFTRIGRGAALLAVMSMPISVMIYKQKQKLWQSILFLLASFLIITLLPMRSAIISILLSFISFILVYSLRKSAIIVIFSCIIIALTSAPYISLNYVNFDTTKDYASSIPSSWRHRLVIWEYCSKLIAAKPLLGYGLETSRELGKTAPQKIITTEQNEDHPHLASALPLHPHNMAIQVWLELGLLGIAAFALLIFQIMKTALKRIRNDDIITAATITSVSASGFFIASFSFGIWQNWWLAGLFLSVMLVKISKKKHI